MTLPLLFYTWVGEVRPDTDKSDIFDKYVHVYCLCSESGSNKIEDHTFFGTIQYTTYMSTFFDDT